VSYEINRTTSNVKRNPGGIKSLTAAVFIAARPPAAAGQPSTARTTAELNALRRTVLNALGLKPAAGQNLEELVTLQETTFQPVVIDECVAKLATESRIQGWVGAASRYLSVAIAIGALLLFYRMLRGQRVEPVPMDLLTPFSANSARNNGPAVLTPELLNELIRQKPANVGTALRDWIGTKQN
jgi:flagellar M-ring protein FliF